MIRYKTGVFLFDSLGLSNGLPGEALTFHGGERKHLQTRDTELPHPQCLRAYSAWLTEIDRKFLTWG